MNDPSRHCLLLDGVIQVCRIEFDHGLEYLWCDVDGFYKNSFLKLLSFLRVEAQGSLKESECLKKEGM